MKFLKYTAFFLLGAFVASVVWLCLAVFTDLFLDINLESNKDEEQIETQDEHEEEEESEHEEESDEPVVKLDGKWNLESINGVENNDGVFLEFGEEHSVSGFAGCNNLSTTYEHSHDDHSIEFEPAITTLKLCDTGSDTETEFLSILEDVNFAEINKDDMLTLSSNTDELVFSRD